jgi:hypothetical protein
MAEQSTNPHPDGDLHKGAIEDDSVHRPGEPNDATNTSMSGQIGHRSSETQTGGTGEGEDSDFPEPGESPEHSGQRS